MAGQEVTTKFKVDISDLKRNIADANQQMRLANAQFKASASSMDDWASSADGLSAKIKQMTSVVNAQESKLSAYKSQLVKVQEAYEENAKRADELRTQMAQLIEDGVDPASDEYKEYQKALQDVTKEQDANKKAANDLEVTILNQEAALNSTKKELGTYETALTELEEAQNKTSDSTEDQKSAYESLEETITDQQAALDKLKQSYADAVVQYGKNSDEAKDLEGSIKDLSGELSTNKQKLKDADSAADDLDDSLKKVDDSADKATEGFTVMKGVIANLAAEAITRAVDGLKNLGQAAFDAYQEYDDGADTVIKATGATGEAAEGLAKSYKKVSKSVLGDFNAIGSALGEINTRFGFTDEQLEDASVQFMKFAEITGMDATSAVKLVSRAMGDAGIESEKYSEVLDALAVAFQASGISIDALTGNLTKYGAPMRALGLDTKDAIAIFAGWEKAGVNTEIAFSGMKQAIGKWSKEGKNAKTEFKKVLKEIKAAPNIADATGKAIEAFGQKAGPDLADAIQGGRFEYSEFLELLEDSEGTVTRTYEATQDGFDKVKLAIQGGKAEIGDYVAQLADEYAPEIEDFANETVDALKDVIKWSAENTSVLAGFGAAITGAFAVSEVSKFVNTVSETVGVIKKVTAAAKSAETATKLLNIAQAATPWGLAALAIGGVTAALIALKTEQDKAIQAEYGLTEAQKGTIEAAKEEKEAYESMDSARQASMDAISAEYGYLDELKNEYNDLIDGSGKVKKGYEDRANFILEQLASAMGVERSEIEKNIEANGKLGDSIDAIIQKKQAEALLSANQDAYTTAIRERDKALQTYQSSLKTLDEAEQKYNDTVNESGDALGKYQELLKTSPDTADDFYWSNRQLIEGQKEAKAAYEEAKQGVEDSEEAYIGYINTISNYEGLGAAIVSGDAKAIDQQMIAIKNGLITARNGNKESLEKQVKDAEQTYKDMRQAAADGMAGVSEETVDQAAKMVEMSKKELAKFNGTFFETFDELKTKCDEAGVNIPHYLARGIQNGQYALPQSVDEMQALVNFGNLQNKARQAGIDVPEYVKNGIQDGSMKPSEAVQIMNDLVTYNDLLAQAQEAGVSVPKKISAGIESGKISPSKAIAKINKLMEQEASKSSAELKDAGKSGASSYTEGVSSNAGNAKSAGEKLKQSAKSGATGKLDKEGTDGGKSYANAVESQSGNAKTAGDKLKQSAKTGASGSLDAEGKSGASGYVEGVNSKKSEANSAGASLKEQAKSGSSGGYSAMNTEGQNAAQGFLDGILSKASAIASAAASLVTKAINAAKQAQDSHSPSRIWRDEIGEMSGEGYIIGLANKIRPAMDEARTLVRDSINAASNEMRRNPFDVSGLGLRSSMASAAGSFSTPTPIYGGVGRQGGSGNTVITYNQTINSPKAPSRIELYRQTRNLLEYTKGGV